MNCYTALCLAEKWNIDLSETFIEVSKQASKINGTRAELVCGDVISLWDVMHGMMMPSGNDAAICVAEYFGQLIYKKMLPEYHRKYKNTNYAINYFINEMNKNAVDLELIRTKFANPHGLGNTNNKSTAEDVGKLCSFAMKIPRFKELVTCKEYSCIAVNSQGKAKYYNWINTHKLLWEGYLGIKTGITPHAGPCLASYYKKGNNGIIVILLNSKSLDARWNETKKLVKLAISRLNYEKYRLC